MLHIHTKYLSHSVLQHFKDACCAHSSTDTHRDDTELLALALQFTHHADCQDRARCTQRMAKRNGSSVEVDFVYIQPKFTNDAKRLGSECFVQFPYIDVINRQSSQFQSFWNGYDRTDAHHFRWYAACGKRAEFRDWFQAQRFCFFAVHPQQSAGAIRSL